MYVSESSETIMCMIPLVFLSKWMDSLRPPDSMPTQFLGLLCACAILMSGSNNKTKTYFSGLNSVVLYRAFHCNRVPVNCVENTWIKHTNQPTSSTHINIANNYEDPWIPWMCIYLSISSSRSLNLVLHVPINIDNDFRTCSIFYIHFRLCPINLVNFNNQIYHKIIIVAMKRKVSLSIYPCTSVYVYACSFCISEKNQQLSNTNIHL